MSKLNLDQYTKTLKKQHSFGITKDVKAIVKKVCGAPKGKNYSMHLTIQEMIEIDDKKDDNQKLKLYVGVIDTLIQCLNIIYPFINFEGIALDWTMEKIIKIIQETYYTLPRKTLDELKNDGRIKL